MRYDETPATRSQRDFHAIAEIVGRIDDRQLRRNVESLAAIGPRSIDDVDAVRTAILYLRKSLAEFGYTVLEEPYDDGSHEVNLLASLTGTSAAEIVELGAHYDTVRHSPGADDNGSGVAAVLEIARVLAGTACRRTIRFCLFGAEESGLRGSYGHVARLDENRDERIQGIAVFEMIGFRTSEPNSQRTPIRVPFVIWPPRVGDFITVVSDFASRSIATRFERAAERYVAELKVYAVKRLGGLIRDAARSDHRPYWESRRQGIMITDTANFRNPHYHQATDMPDTLDYDFMRQIAQATAAMLLEWAGLGEA